MADLRIVAKALEDFGDDWHWVVLHDAEQIEDRLYRANYVDTLCGIMLDEAPMRVRLHDTGAPDEPNCRRCLNGGLDPALAADIEAAIQEAEAAPV